MKALPKSLHTITALVNVARHYKATHDGITHKAAVFAALAILGYGDLTKEQDAYGLVDKAVATLTKEA